LAVLLALGTGCPFFPFEDDFGKTCDPEVVNACSEGLVCEPDPEAEGGGVCVPPRTGDGGNSNDGGDFDGGNAAQDGG
jgi:hypothetical protein